MQNRENIKKKWGIQLVLKNQDKYAVILIPSLLLMLIIYVTSSSEMGAINYDLRLTVSWT